jgi:hypothetical protein
VSALASRGAMASASNRVAAHGRDIMLHRRLWQC